MQNSKILILLMPCRHHQEQRPPVSFPTLFISQPKHPTKSIEHFHLKNYNAVVQGKEVQEETTTGGSAEEEEEDFSQPQPQPSEPPQAQRTMQPPFEGDGNPLQAVRR
jgi:hypothetical protein